jgi:hypothetical protein
MCAAATPLTADAAHEWAPNCSAPLVLSGTFRAGNELGMLSNARVGARRASESRAGRRIFVGLIAGVLFALAATPAAAQVDYSGGAHQILAPGEYGALPPTANSTDQGMLYDALTPLRGNVTPADLDRYYLSEKFGVQGPVARTESTGRPGLQILRDRNDIPHINGQTRDDVMFGSG